MKTLDVFGVSNKHVASYIERKDVDLRFLEGLNTNKHIVVFGASKQGKTALINKHLDSENFITVNCSPQTMLIDIYKSILRQLGFEFKVESTKKQKATIGAETSIKAKVKIPFLGSGDAGLSGKGESSKEKTTSYHTIEYNLSLPQDMSEILKTINFNSRIILENFHYLNENTQRDLAFHLRSFEDSNILFIILGIWREKNRLTQFNGDLQDRIIEVPVEPWLNDEFKKVAKLGGDLLMVSFDNIIDDIIENSFGSIGVFQELCKEACLAANILKKQTEIVQLTEDNREIAIKIKIESYAARHIRCIEVFAEQKSKTSIDVPLYLGYYFISYLFNLDFNTIESGIKRSDLHIGIQKIHHRPDDVRSSDISYFLHNLTTSQIKKNIIPPLFDYDRSTREVKIIDSTFYFFLKNSRDQISDELNDYDELS